MALTKSDKDWVQKLLQENNRLLGYMMDDKIEDAKEDIKEQATEYRSDIMNHISSFAGEIKANEEERTVQSSQITRNTRRIEKLEKAVFN